MGNMIYCELLKIKRSKMLLVSILGALATPFMILIEALQTHYEYPDRIFTLDDIFDNSMLYVMLLMNMMVFVVIEAHIFSREYSENTLRTILPLGVSRAKIVVAKFILLFVLGVMLNLVSWLAILILTSIYKAIFGLAGFEAVAILKWLIKFLVSAVFMYITISPFAYLAEKTKHLVSPIIYATVIVMASAALCNQDLGRFYPWTASYFIVNGRIGLWSKTFFVSFAIIMVVSIVGYIMTFNYFNKEDL